MPVREGVVVPVTHVVRCLPCQHAVFRPESKWQLRGGVGTTSAVVGVADHRGGRKLLPAPKARRARGNMHTHIVLLDATGLSRGHFWLNGHDLGKFWTIKGPSGQLTQRYYHLPSALLKPMPGSRCAVWHLGGSPF
eukprot:COSAG01_NODE_736_length_13947_cov_174.337449_4_plen_136_part_00